MYPFRSTIVQYMKFSSNSLPCRPLVVLERMGGLTNSMSWPLEQFAIKAVFWPVCHAFPPNILGHRAYTYRRFSKMFSDIFLLILVVFVSKCQTLDSVFEVEKDECTAHNSTKRDSICINIGGENESVGPYLADKNFVQYVSLGTGPRAVLSKRGFSSTIENSLAFARQMEADRELILRVGVERKFTYELELGFACINRCNANTADTSIWVQNEEKDKINVFGLNGKHNPLFVFVSGVTPSSKGVIEIKLRSADTAALATLCVKREPIVIAPCSQDECERFAGSISYTQIHGSFFSQLDGACSFSTQSSEILNYPRLAKVVKAFLIWSAVGTPSENSEATLKLNTDIVSGKWSSEGTGYLAKADVTSIVEDHQSGGYIVEDIDLDTTTTCDAGYASWILLVVYEEDDLPFSVINTCTVGSTDSISVACTVAHQSHTSNLLLAVTQTNDTMADNSLHINGQEAIQNVFTENAGHSFDVIEKDISPFISNTSSDSSVLVSSSSSEDPPVYMALVIKDEI